MSGKTCPECRKHRAFSRFHRNRSRKDGYARICKDCKRHYDRSWFRRNKDQSLKASREWKENNRERCRAYSKAWKKQNPDLAAACNAARRARKLKATPPWFEFDPVAQMYSLSRMLGRLQRNRRAGIVFTVDHRVALQAKRASGLHCYDNLLPIPKEENTRKGNGFDPDEHVHFLP